MNRHMLHFLQHMSITVKSPPRVWGTYFSSFPAMQDTRSTSSSLENYL